VGCNGGAKGLQDPPQAKRIAPSASGLLYLLHMKLLRPYRPSASGLLFFDFRPNCIKPLSPTGFCDHTVSFKSSLKMAARQHSPWGCFAGQSALTSGCHSPARWAILLRLRHTGIFTAPSRSPCSLTGRQMALHYLPHRQAHRIRSNQFFVWPYRTKPLSPILAPSHALRSPCSMRSR
jgi:hypothetical protein